MGEIEKFLSKLDKWGYVTLNVIGEDSEIFTVGEVMKKISEIGVSEIGNTYWEQVEFESKNGDIYELIAL